MSKIYELPGEIYENFETGKIKGFKRTLIIMLSPLLVVVGASICIAIVGYDFVKGNRKNKPNYKELLDFSCSGCYDTGIHHLGTTCPCRYEDGIGEE